MRIAAMDRQRPLPVAFEQTQMQWQCQPTNPSHVRHVCKLEPNANVSDLPMMQPVTAKDTLSKQPQSADTLHTVTCGQDLHRPTCSPVTTNDRHIKGAQTQRLDHGIL